jgi:hypothetical protein
MAQSARHSRNFLPFRAVTSTRPAVGSTSRLIIRRSVDLPAPEPPITPINTPSATDKLTPSTAAFAPNQRDAPSSTNMRHLHRALACPRPCTVTPCLTLFGNCFVTPGRRAAVILLIRHTKLRYQTAGSVAMGDPETGGSTGHRRQAIFVTVPWRSRCWRLSSRVTRPPQISGQGPRGTPKLLRVIIRAATAVAAGRYLRGGSKRSNGLDKLATARALQTRMSLLCLLAP